MNFIDENGNRKLINDRFDYHGVEFVTVKDERNMLTVYEPAYGVEVKTGKYDQLFSLNNKLDEIAKDIDQRANYKESCEFEKNYLGEIALDVIKNNKQMKNKSFNQKFVEKLEKLRRQVLEKSKKGIAIGVAFAACCCFAPKLAAESNHNISVKSVSIAQYDNPVDYYKDHIALNVIEIKDFQHELNREAKDLIKEYYPNLKESNKKYESILRETIVGLCEDNETLWKYGNSRSMVEDEKNSYSAFYFSDTMTLLTAECVAYKNMVKNREIDPVLEINKQEQIQKKNKSIDSGRGF